MARRQAFFGSVAFVALLLMSVSIASAVRDRDCAGVESSIRAELATACPCEAATSHAEHVRCVTKKLRELSSCRPGTEGSTACGNVPRACIGKIRRVASRSACGNPTAVTCCIPKQYDCVGDANPGDGQAEGVCAGNKQRCDRVTDCMRAKCQVAADEERCRLAGGTPGTGKDCSTACAP